MTTQQTSTEAHTRLINFRPEDVKNLVQFNGKAKEGNFEFVLKTPAVTDAHLKSVLNDPYVEIRTVKDQTTTGEMYFDLVANARHVRIKVICHTLPTTKNH